MVHGDSNYFTEAEKQVHRESDSVFAVNASSVKTA